MRRRTADGRLDARTEVDVSTDRPRLPVARASVIRAVRATLRADGVRSARLSIAFVSNARIAALNRTHLGHRGPTDVISFGLTPRADRARRRAVARPARAAPVIGDVYIAPDVARANANANGVGVREEIIRLVVHATLHVLGYDHPETGDRTRSVMWQKQERLVRRLAKDARR